MPLRVAILGGLKDPGFWDAYARTVGESLAKAGVGLSLAVSSGFARATLQGYLKAEPEPAPGLVRVHEDREATPEDLAPFTVDPLPRGLAGDPFDQLLRETDATLIAGNGPGLQDAYRKAVQRHAPALPLPIPGATSEDLWERDLRRRDRVFPDADLRAAYLGLRRPDPRSQQSALTLAGLLVGLAGAPTLPGGPRVLLAHRPGPGAPPGEDDLPLLLRRALRAHAPGASVEEAPPGWLTSPGKAFAEATARTDLFVTELGTGALGALYALGIARGAGRPAIALAGKDERLGLDPRALDVIQWESDRELAARLEGKIRATFRTGAPGLRPAAGKRKPQRQRGRRRPRTGKQPGKEGEGRSPRPGERDRGGGRKEG